MAKELAHFKNFAKLKDTKVAFNDITVIAGKPGTGKSYVMKFMYGINEALSKLIYDYSLVRKHMLAQKELSNEMYKLEQKISSKNKNLLKEIKELEQKHILLNKESKKILKPFNYFDNLEEVENSLELTYPNILKAIFISLEEISSNFSLKYKNTVFTYKNSIFNIDNSPNQEYLSFNNIFVETPLILEFKKFMSREKGKTPYHIESLLNILDTDYSFTNVEQDKFIKNFTQKSKEIIKGDIESSGDSFIFNQEGGKNYDILNASSGTKSIGLLQYLVTNKALKKGSVLYWEEPEVHLHPEWQLRMIELFVELMNAGVKIVFSTHSPYMCDYLNAISQKQGFDDRVSFNLFEEKDGVVENHILDDDNWNKIQAELLDPLEEIMWEYI